MTSTPLWLQKLAALSDVKLEDYPPAPADLDFYAATTHPWLATLIAQTVAQITALSVAQLSDDNINELVEYALSIARTLEATSDR